MAEQTMRARVPGEKIWWWPNMLTYGRIAAVPVLATLLMYDSHRSEERRVGKECAVRCRSRWSPYH